MIAAQLAECMATILVEVRELRAEVARRVAGAEDMTAPMMAEELCARWGIEAPTRALRLTYLARKCRAWGLRPLAGTCGEAAMYARDDVLHAESFAAGKMNRRRNAR